MKKNTLIALSTLIIVSLSSVVTIVPQTKKTDRSPMTKQAEDIFCNWIEWQNVFEPQNIATMSNSTIAQLAKPWATHNIKNLTKIYPGLLTTLAENNDPTLEVLTNNAPKHLKDVYTKTQINMPALVKKLQKLSLCNGNNAEHKDYQKELDRYLSLSAFMYGQPDDREDNALLLSVANQFAEYLLSPSTFPDVQRLFSSKKNFPLLKFLYATTWHNLVGIGWKTWSSECIKSVKKAADQGKQIVYLAGGSDIYQLLSNGIYNISIIDPQLPTQSDYYAQGWSWIMKGTREDGGIGDTMVFKDKDLMMKRISYQEEPTTFTALITPDKTSKKEKEKSITIHPSKTIWAITTKAGKEHGTCIIDRRFVNQDDFKTTPDKTLLVAFNEMFFICAPDDLEGWRIDPSKFPDDIQLMVKQLHKPVTKQMLCNLRTTSILNEKKLEFINLGCCSN